MEPKRLVAKTPLRKSRERPVRERPLSVRGQTLHFGGVVGTSAAPQLRTLRAPAAN
jgi:hypothetical protein